MRPKTVDVSFALHVQWPHEDGFYNRGRRRLWWPHDDDPVVPHYPNHFARSNNMEKVTYLVFFLFLLPFNNVIITALPTMRQAPRMCPLENGNLLDVVLFARSS